MGRVIAKNLGLNGAVVVIIDKDKTQFKELQGYFAKFKPYFFSVPVENSEKVRSVVKNVYQKFRRIDILVNCAGILGPVGEFNTNDLRLWQNTLAVNLLGTVNACHAVLPFMVKKKQGKIINLAGGGAVEPFPNFSAYASSKAGVVRFTENLAKEYQPFNIEVNAVSPGIIQTKLREDLLRAGEQKVGSRYFKDALLLKKRGGDSPEQAAELVLFLSSPKNQLTGKVISSKWDPWQKFTSQKIKRLNKSSDYSLRRIDNKYFKEIVK